jgi:hypothetical protein
MTAPGILHYQEKSPSSLCVHSMLTREFIHPVLGKLSLCLLCYGDRRKCCKRLTLQMLMMTSSIAKDQPATYFMTNCPNTGISQFCIDLINHALL